MLLLMIGDAGVGVAVSGCGVADGVELLVVC